MGLFGSKTALILIDVQYDFMPGGSLAVPQGDEILPVIKKIRSKGKFDYVFRTQDWHPPNHMSFAANNGDKKPFDVLKLKDGSEQVMWPNHCVQGSHGAEFHSDLGTPAKDEVIVQKGTDASIDSYSGFWDNGRKKETKLEQYLKDKNVSRVYICGLATDYCVSYSALDAVTAGFETYVLWDACRGITAEGTEAQKQKMIKAGISIITSDDL